MKQSTINKIISYEEGTLSDKETLRLFRELIRTKTITHLQGHYQRTANALIEDGFFDYKGNYTQKARNYINNY